MPLFKGSYIKYECKPRREGVWQFAVSDVLLGPKGGDESQKIEKNVFLLKYGPEFDRIKGFLCALLEAHQSY